MEVGFHFRSTGVYGWVGVYCMRDVLRWFVGYEGFVLGVMGFDLSARRDII